MAGKTEKADLSMSKSDRKQKQGVKDISPRRVVPL